MNERDDLDAGTLFLPDELLLDYNFFELYPFDGGGYFIQKQLVGSLDDHAITDRVLAGALEEFGGLENLDFTRFENWRCIEKSCWINRLYVVASLARCARLREDVSLARRVLEIVARFNEQCPPPRDAEEVRRLNEEVTYRREHDYNCGRLEGEVPYQWYDFQPASRVVNVLNAMNFLRNFPLSLADAARCVRHNARVIYDGDDEHHLTRDNHQALRGLALLYAGRFLRDDEYVRRGQVVWSHHMLSDFCPDGMQIDMSPSYHVFESWIAREGLRLGGGTEEVRCRLSQAFGICSQLRQPDFGSLVLNDGYSLDMRGFLKSLGLEGRTPAAGERLALTSSGLAVGRTPKVFAVLDDTRCLEKYAHYHGGKNGLTLWLQDRPFLVDSGCCSYDDERFQRWFKLPQAHSTLLVNGRGDGTLVGRYEWREVRPYVLEPWQGLSVTGTSGSWRRTLTLEEAGITVKDRIGLEQESQLELVFVLHPGVRVELGAGKIVLRNSGVRVALTWESSLPVGWSLCPGMVYAGDRVCPSQRLVCACTGQALCFETHWVIVG